MKVRALGVVGAGQMGSGIAHVAAQSGLSVVMRDLSDAFVAKGLDAVGKNLQRGVDKGKMTPAEKDAVLGRIKGTTKLEDLAGCDIVVEAAIEKLDVKLELFQALDRIVKPEAILATNTSSLPITRIAAATGRPGKVIGMHFMNPVPVMKLVEVIRGLQTEDATAADTKALAESMGKTAVECRDFPGFVSNRVLLPMINEAVYCLHEGVADAAAIDTIMKLGMNHPMGPLTLADFIGLDTCLYILEVLHEGLGDDKYRPCPLLKKYVEAGWLGKKTGRGFYEYGEGKAGAPRLIKDAGIRLEIALAIVVRRGEVLVARRAGHQHLAGAWEFPGGKIDENEDPAAAALRELREEAGLTATAVEPLLIFVHDYPDRRLRFHAFVVSDAEGEVTTDGDRAFSWVAPASLEELDMPEANRAILRALRWRLR